MTYGKNLICIIALVVFSILGIFSASHRKLAAEAFDCVFRRVTLRPCNTGFDQKMKAQILGKLIGRSETLARFVNRYFEWLSWSLLILTAVSLFFSLQGAYYYYLYGNCNGPTSSGFCVFDPTGANSKTSGVTGGCSDVAPADVELDLSALNLTNYPRKQAETERQLVFIGCFSCEYTRKAYPIIQELLNEFPTNYTFIHFPVKPETTYLSEIGFCMEQYPEHYWTWVDRVFALSLEEVIQSEKVYELIGSLGVDAQKIQACTETEMTKTAVAKRHVETGNTGLYGTPTIFINGEPVVGPKPKRVYERMLTGQWWKLW